MIKRRNMKTNNQTTTENNADSTCCWVSFVTIGLFMWSLGVLICGIISVYMMYNLPPQCTNGLLATSGIWTSVPFFLVGFVAGCMASGQTPEDYQDSRSVFIICAVVVAVVFVPAVIFCNIMELVAFTTPAGGLCNSYGALKIVTTCFGGAELVTLLIGFLLACRMNKRRPDLD